MILSAEAHLECIIIATRLPDVDPRCLGHLCKFKAHPNDPGRKLGWDQKTCSWMHEASKGASRVPRLSQWFTGVIFGVVLKYRRTGYPVPATSV